MENLTHWEDFAPDCGKAPQNIGMRREACGVTGAAQSIIEIV
jgi:hypothetical protein